MFDRELRAPIDIVLWGSSGFEYKEEFIEEMYTGLCASYALAREQLGKCAERNKHTYDMRVRPANFLSQPGFSSLTLGVILVDRRKGRKIILDRF